MHIRKFLPATLIIFLVLPIAVVTQHAGTPQKTRTPSDLPVTSTITDYIDVTDSTTGSVQRYWMQIRSDGAGTYTNSSSLVSIIQGASGDWILDSKNATSPTRTVFLDFTKPIPGTGPNGGPPVAPFTSALVFARLISKCHLYNNDMFTIAPGSTVNCPLAIFFSDSGNEYFLQMNPVTGTQDAFPETDYVNATCNGTGANFQCNNWTITPNGSKGGCLTTDCALKQNVSRLSLRVPVKGRSGSWTAVNQGDFDLAFSIGVTNP
jgi:hypothetical protein